MYFDFWWLPYPIQFAFILFVVLILLGMRKRLSRTEQNLEVVLSSIHRLTKKITTLSDHLQSLAQQTHVQHENEQTIAREAASKANKAEAPGQQDVPSTYVRPDSLNKNEKDEAEQISGLMAEPEASRLTSDTAASPWNQLAGMEHEGDFSSGDQQPDDKQQFEEEQTGETFQTSAPAAAHAWTDRIVVSDTVSAQEQSVPEYSTASEAPQTPPSSDPEKEALPDIPHAVQEEHNRSLETAPPFAYQYDEPVQPTFVENAISGFTAHVMAFIRGGNIWVAAGVLMLLLGFAFLLTYMAEQGYFSVELRIALAVLTGIGMVGFGLKLRDKKPVYALIMQGGGIGILYLSAFASAKLTTLLPPTAALVAMTVLIVPAVALALLQNAQILALFAFFGGYAAPLLLSTGSGDYVALFSYYTLLNLALLGICRFRIWRWLNLMGAICTFAVMAVWGLMSYLPSMYPSVQPFLLGFAAIFVLITVWSLHKQEFSLKRPPDVILALGVPFVAVLFQWRISQELEHGLGISAVSFGAAFILLALTIWKRWGGKARRLAEFYIVSGATLANLALPLEAAGGVSSAIWAVEGAIFFFFGCRSRVWQIKLAGLILQAAAALMFGWEIINAQANFHYVIPAGMLALAALSSAFGHAKQAAVPLHSQDDKGEQNESAPSFDLPLSIRQVLDTGGSTEQPQEFSLERVLTIFAFFCWFGGLLLECYHYSHDPFTVFFLCASLSASVLFAAARYLGLHDLFLACWVVVPLSVAKIVWALVPAESILQIPELSKGLRALFTHQFLTGTEGLAWLAFFVSQALFASTARRRIPELLNSLWMYTVTIGILVVLTCSCRAFAQGLGLSTAWISFAGILPSLVYLCCLIAPAVRRRLALGHWLILFGRVPVVMFILIGIWFVFGMFKEGSPAPLPFFVPLFNPLELRQALCIALFLLWQKTLRESTQAFPVIDLRTLAYGLDILIFVWLHSVIARTTHFYAGVPLHAVWDETMFQILLTGLWGLTGMIHIIAGNKLRLRIMWTVGAALMALVALKLFLLDLADKETILRIVSFFVVGGICLLIGLMAPLPPRAGKKNGDGESAPDTYSGPDIWTDPEPDTDPSSALPDNRGQRSVKENNDA